MQNEIMCYAMAYLPPEFFSLSRNLFFLVLLKLIRSSLNRYLKKSRGLLKKIGQTKSCSFLSRFLEACAEINKFLTETTSNFPIRF